MRAWFACVLLAVPAAASAQTTACPGSDPARGAALHPRIRDLYERATGHRRLRSRELDEVVALATEQCRAGDDRGLVWRAAARYALACARDGACERPDAATRETLGGIVRDLDDYLAAHPPGSLTAGQLAFIAPIEAGIARYVAQVRVVARPAGAVVRVGGRDLAGDVRVHLIGPSTITISAEGYEGQTLPLSGDAGSSVSLAITVGGDEPVPQDAQRVLLRRLVAPTRVLSSATPSSAMPTSAEDVGVLVGVREVSVTRARPLRTWAVATGATAGAFVVAGIGFTIWRQERSASYLGSGCGAASTDMACIAVYDDFDTAKSLQVASFATAGVFAAGAVALWCSIDATRVGRGAARTGSVDVWRSSAACAARGDGGLSPSYEVWKVRG